MTKDTQGWTRRDFIKMAGTVAAGLPVISSTTPNSTERDSDDVTGMLKGVSDLHVHAKPDSVDRSINELNFARQAQQAGYKSIMYKSNDFSCHDRAFIMRQALPDFEVFGSLIMNKVHGGRVNVRAAEKAVQTTGNYCRCIWMPTLDAVYYLDSLNSKEKGIPVLDDAGKVLPEVVRVMEICAEADIIFATGHSSPDENMVLARKANEVGIKKFVITHANSSIWSVGPDRINQLIDLGAYIEFCVLPMLWGPGTSMPDYPYVSPEKIASLVNVAPERSFITTDLGQANMPHPLEGMRTCITELLKAGVSQQNIDLLVRKNPEHLVGAG